MSNTVKHILSLTLATVLLLSFTSCGSPKTMDVPGSNPAPAASSQEAPAPESAKEEEPEEELMLILSPGAYLSEEIFNGSHSGPAPELFLWENGIGILNMNDNMYGVEWEPDRLRIEKEDVEFSGHWHDYGPDGRSPVLDFSFGGEDLSFMSDNMGSDSLPSYYWGANEYGTDRITGTYLNEDGTKAVFNKDGTGTLKAGGSDEPIYWGYHEGYFIITDSYLSAIKTSKDHISFSTDRKTTLTLESELAIAKRELEEKIQKIAPYYLPLGNAGELDGKIVVYSIFANGPDYSWDFSQSPDRATRDKILNDMSQALEWITKQAAKYGRNVEFLYDWNADPELAVESTSEFPMAYSSRKAYEESIEEGKLVTTDQLFAKQRIAFSLANAKDLREKYGADGVVYMFYVNTDFSNTVVPHAVPYWPDILRWSVKVRDLVELATMHMHFTDKRVAGSGQKRTIGATSYAHEILHLFGAPDLYEANDVIPQAYVDHLDAAGSNDIMYGGYDDDGPMSKASMSELTAYYLGLTDYCEDVKKYGLPESQHLKKAE